MAEGSFVKDVTVVDFQDVVLAGSQSRPILVDFWAPWCGPCRALGPILERLAEEYAGKFLLAKVNSDENQELSVKYGVRGIPSVKAFLDGAVIDEFTGALPEGAIRQFLDRLIPSEADKMRQHALTLLAQGQHEEAEALLQQVLQLEPSNSKALLALVKLTMAKGDIAKAEVLLNQIQGVDRMNPEVEAVAARLAFAQKGEESNDESALQSRIANGSGDERAEALFQLANKKIAQEDYEGGMNLLIEMVKGHRKYKDDLARKTLLQVFNLLNNQGELVNRYRTLLSRSLY